MALAVAQRHHRGTVIAYFLILISVMVTGMLTTMAMSSGGEAQVAGVTLKRDQCFYAAEAGVQNAYWMLEANPNWRANTPVQRSVGNVNYSFTCVGDWNSPCLITSVATINNGANGTTTSVTMTAAASPTVTVPAISLGGNFSNSGNVTIAGDVQTTGSISTSGNLNETGSLFAGGVISTNGSVAISGTTNPNTAGITTPAVPTAALKAAATQVVVVPPTGANITSVNLGQGGIIYYQGGPVTFQGSVSVTGYGTIVTDSAVTVRSAASLGSSMTPANLNLVCGGNLTIDGYLGVIGSIYVNGNISKHGGLDITGVLVAAGTLNTNGGFTMTRAQPPSWDPRSANPGAMVLSRITGPIF